MKQNNFGKPFFFLLFVFALLISSSILVQANNFNDTINVALPPPPRFLVLPFSLDPQNPVDIIDGWQRSGGSIQRGIDYGRKDGLGFVVKAAADGWATYEFDHATWGNHVSIVHPNGWQTNYAHLATSTIPDDKQTHWVNAGDIIGFAGKTGYWEKERITPYKDIHLHFELAYGNYRESLNRVDPYGVNAKIEYYKGKRIAFLYDDIDAYPEEKSLCPLPQPSFPSNGLVFSSGNVAVNWNHPNNCVGQNGFILRIGTSDGSDDVLSNQLVTTLPFRTVLNSQWFDKKLYWAVRSNIPGESWSISRYFSIHAESNASQNITINNWLPWYFLITTGDDRVIDVYLDGKFLFGKPSCAKALLIGSGNHTVTYNYRNPSAGIPIVQLKRWPFVSPVCAAEWTDPPPSDPIPSDSNNSQFVSDLTLPDGTFVSPGQSLTKSWRLQNTGTTTWGAGYKLVFVDGEQMGAPPATDIVSTAPNTTLDLSVPITAPTAPGEHTGYFQLRNPQGTYFGPRIWVKINVRTPSSKISVLTADPTSPADAKTVRVYARADGIPNLRAIRLKVDGQLIGEYGGAEHTFDWNTAGFAAGAHNIVLEAADQTDTAWARPEVRSMAYTLLGTTASPNLKPNKPTLLSPYDWYVYYSGSTATLCAQANGDPDGDSIAAYNFEIHDSGQNWSSGWTGNSCVTTSSLPAYTYQWHAQVKDSRGAVSDWSTDFHFTLVNQNLSISSFSLTPLDGSSERVRLKACVTGQGGVGITIRFLLNSATNGTDSGSWTNIGELGVPCFSDNDAPIWETLRDNKISGDGQHLVRVEAHGAATGWNGAVSQDQVYTLPHRRPSNADLKAPIPASRNNREAVYLNSRTVHFVWYTSDRATSYRLSVGLSPAPKDDPSPVFRQTYPAGTTQAAVNFSQDYPTLYWQIEAINDAGINSSTDQLFGIDRAAPTCTIQPLAAASYENNFKVQWGGTDALSGIASYNIQYKDSRGNQWSDWMTVVPAAKIYDLFTGQAGHTYSFRCQALDNAGNLGAYPGAGDTAIKIDPAARPPEPWWNASYASKRSLTIQNNMPGMVMPAGYPVKLLFDSGSTPTAAQLYAGSLSPTKCDDLRIIYNNSTQVDRVVRKCATDGIEIWFRTQASIDAGGTNVAHLLYYGNSTPDAPPADPRAVWYSYGEAGTQAYYTFSETSGSIAYDSSGYGRNCTIGPTVTRINGKFSGAMDFSRANNGSASGLVCGSMALSAFTIEMWYRPDPNWGDAIAAQMQDGVGNSWSLWNDGGRLRMEIWHCPSCASHQTRSNANLNNPPYVGKWNHIMVVFAGGNSVQYFINGALDSTQYMDLGGINSLNIPLQIGAINNGGQTAADIGIFQITSGVKGGQPYALFSAITNEPAAKANDLIPPPAAGTPDLAIASLNAYPNPSGGMLVEAVVQNAGTLSTINGFFTDLYVNQLPTGPGFYTGSLQFWVNDPIPAGSTVTLTTVLPSLPGTLAVMAGGITETTGTLYAQTDSTGALNESTKGNNISSPTEVCVASADLFEPDDTPAQASTLALRQAQAHNFDKPGDADWAKFSAVKGRNYIISTSALGPAADTYLYLYGPDGTTLLASNDDAGSSLASQIQWQAPAAGTYYVLVKHWNPNVAGCGTTYSLTLAETYTLLIPLITNGPAPVVYKISGQILDSQQNPVVGVSVSLGTVSVTSNSLGFYTFTGLQANTYTVTPSNAGYTFTPPNRLVTVGPDAASQDFTANFASNTWKTVASIPTARTLVSAATGSNGLIYVIGGQNGSGALAVVEEYNPATNTWSTKASLPTARQALGVAAASNGKLYAIGGQTQNGGSYTLATVEEYNPVTNTWSTKASMPTPRAGLGVAAASNGKIYAIGGLNGSGALSTVEEYDPALNTWTAKASMVNARYSAGVAAASNGKIYVFGGYGSGGSAVVEEYNPELNAWTSKASMSIARWNIGSAAAGSGKIYLFGGQSLGPAVVEYDPTTDTWTTKASLLLGDRICPAAAVSLNGKVYAIGGHNGSGVPLATVEEYTP